jgi:carbohydrate-selective porin OprB
VKISDYLQDGVGTPAIMRPKQLTSVAHSRPSDTVGLGFALNGLAQSQITYLQQGGISPFIGDGKLNYKKEQIFESYYSAKIYKDLVLTVDFQRIANPAYNASRGPVNILGIRAHIEI